MINIDSNYLRYLTVFFVCFILIFSSNFSLAACLDDVAVSTSSSSCSLLDNKTISPPAGLFEQTPVNTEPSRSAQTTRSKTRNTVDQNSSDDDLIDEFDDLKDGLNASLPAKNGGVDQYGQAGASVTNTIEHTKKLPANVTVGKKNVNIPGYLNGGSTQIININKTQTNKTVIPSNSTQPLETRTDTIKAGTIDRKTYMDVITDINNNFGKGITPATIKFKWKDRIVDMGYENLVYFTSQILYSYSMTKKLPDAIVIYPWSTITQDSTVFIPMAGLSTATDTITSYTQTQHKLPPTITVDNHKLNMAAMLKLEARSLLNLQNNLYQSILLKGDYYVPQPNNKGQPYTEDNIDGYLLPKIGGKYKGQEGYSQVITNVNDYINQNDLEAPDFAYFKGGKIGFYSLVYLFADILNSVVHTNKQPDNVPLVSWAKLSDKNTNFLSMDEINTAAETVKSNLEIQHTLPDTVNINGITVTPSNFLYLLAKSIKNTQNGYYGSIVSPNYGAASGGLTEKGHFPKRLRQDTYLIMVDKVLAFYGDHNCSPSTININPGEVRWENMIFMLSQVLTHSNANNNILPYYLGVNQWSTVIDTNTIVFSPSQIVNSAVIVKTDIEKAHGISDTYKINIDGHDIGMATYLRLLATTLDVLGGLTASQLILIDYDARNEAYPNYSKLNGERFNMNQYLDYAAKVEWDIINNKRYVASSINGVNYKNWIYTFTQILNSYKSKNSLPNVIMVTPWRVITDVNTKFFTVDDIATAAADVQKYVEINHKLPPGDKQGENAVNVAGIGMTKATFLRLLTTAILNINANLNTTIISLTFSDPTTEADTIRAGNNNKTEYINVLNYVKDFYDKYSAPKYSSNTGLGKDTHMSFANLFYTYSQLLNSYQKNNNTLPNHITVNRWSTIIDAKGFATHEQIITAANTVTNTVEQKHQLPDTVNIGNNPVNMATFLRLITTAVWNIHGNLNTTIPIKTYTAPTLTNETIHSGIMDSDEYIKVLDDIKTNFDLYEHVIDTVDTTNGKIGFNNTIYFYSQLLVSFTKTNNTLPNLVTLKPWKAIKNQDTKFFTPDEMQTAAQSVKISIHSNHMPPQNVTITGTSVDMPSFLKLLSKTVLNTQNYFYSSVIYEKIGDPTIPTENITVPGTLDGDDLTDIAIQVMTSSAKKAPDNISNTNLGTIGYYTLLSTFSNVMASYNCTKPANDSVIVFPSVTWFNPDGTFNFRLGKNYTNIKDAIDDARPGDTIWMGKKEYKENIIINKKIIIRPVYGTNVTITPLNTNLPVFNINHIGNSSTIQGLKITGANIGINLDHTHKNQIFGNNITNNNVGIQVDNSNNNIISGNTIINNLNGLIVTGSLKNTISTNNITNNTGNGIKLNTGTNNTVYSNNIMKNGNGIYITSSTGKIIFNQITENNLYGLYNTGTGTVNATHNWWGTNKPLVTNTPGSTCDICNNGDTLNYEPYLILTLTHSTDRSDRKNTNYKYIIAADLNHDSTGKNTIPDGTIPDTIPINFTTNLGTLTNNTSTTKKGKTSVVLNSSATGTATITASLDSQTVINTLPITAVTVQSITNTRNGKTFKAIQEAIDDPHTRNGDNITLGEGTYTENIIINKKITLTQESNENVTIQPKDDNKSVILITHEGSGSTIQNLYIISSTQSYGIALSHSYNNILQKNTINEAQNGIYLYMSGGNTINENTVTDGTQGIVLYKSTGNTINGNIISRNEIGLVSETSTFNTITENKIQDNYYGSRIVDSNSNTISNNVISGNYVGIYLYNTNNNVLSGNSFVEDGVGIAKCNAIDDAFTNNSFKDSYLSDTSTVETGDYVLATTIYTCGPAALATVYNHL